MMTVTEPAIEVITERAELVRLAYLADEIWHEYYPVVISKEQIDYMLVKFLSVTVLENEIKETGLNCFFIYDALDKGREGICGFVCARCVADEIFLSKLYFKKDARGKGYTRDVLVTLINYYFEIGREPKVMRLTCNKHNENSIQVYKHLGFKIEKEVETDIGGGYVMDDYVFCRAITPQALVKKRNKKSLSVNITKS